jgi:hypothetical protein
LPVAVVLKAWIETRFSFALTIKSSQLNRIQRVQGSTIFVAIVARHAKLFNASQADHSPDTP